MLQYSYISSFVGCFIDYNILLDKHNFHKLKEQ